LFGCYKEKEIIIPDVVDVDEEVVLFIVEANNNLKYEAFQTINRLETSITKSQNILVYVNSDDDNSFLLRVKKDDDEYIFNSDTIARFNKIDDNIITISECLAWIKGKWNISGIVFWSHGTSWYPDTIPNKSLNGKQFYDNHGQIKLKSFGDDRGKKIDIKRLASTIPNVDFLIFDACSMATMEVLYEFKDKAKYIVASPTETLAESMPYQNVTRFLTSSPKDLESICKMYIDYYKSYTDLRRSASISLFDMSKFDLFVNKLKECKYMSLNYDFEKEKIMRLDFSDDFPGPIYDFLGFLSRNFDSREVDLLDGMLRKCILYKGHTESILGNKVDSLSGVGISIVSRYDKYLSYYNKLKWTIDTSFEPVRGR